MAAHEPQRGEVWIVDFGYKEKARPCLVLSVPVNDVERNVVTFVPRTTSDRPGSRFEVVDSSALFPNRPGVFNVQSLNTEDRSTFHRKERRVGRVPDQVLSVVEEKVKLWLGLVGQTTDAPE